MASGLGTQRGEVQTVNIHCLACPCNFALSTYSTFSSLHKAGTDNSLQLQYGPVRSLKATVADIIAVTADNEKQRFSMKPADANANAGSAAESDPSYWLIRANQGHSIAIESEALLTPITLEGGNVPPIVVHGTYFAFWEAIVASGGLSKMGRNHVHCSTGLPEDGAAGVVSGMRGDAELLVYVDVAKSLEEGAMSWWVSENGVVLTEGVGEEGLVPVKYFKEVVGRKEDVGVLWKDGEKVADLPEGVKGRTPPGKGGARGRGGGRGGRGGRGAQGRGGRGGATA